MSRFLANASGMFPLIVLTGVAAGCVALIRERRRRRVAERLSAATLETLLNAIDANDSVTGAHVRRVAAVALALGDALGLDQCELNDLERVALFHDIGKIHAALFDILHDSDELSVEERQAVSTHPNKGSEVLEPLEAFFPELRWGVLAHHERWDGTGYPRGLRGRRIPLSARIVAIADAFDAITHSRRYSPARSEEAAVEAIRAGRGTQFDPELVDLFLLPPVLVAVNHARSLPDVARAGGLRRGRRRARPKPDVTFRWRPKSRAWRRWDLSRVR
jgi:HD-GYP domain-containing protein (c-di-GMP phosphodiesterase class II)